MLLETNLFWFFWQIGFGAHNPEIAKSIHNPVRLANSSPKVEGPSVEAGNLLFQNMGEER
jgi:hypothetical protein